MSKFHGFVCNLEPASPKGALSSRRPRHAAAALDAVAVNLSMARARMVLGRAEHLRWGSELALLQPVSARVSGVSTQLQAFFFINLWKSLAAKPLHRLDKLDRLPAVSKASVSIITRGSAPTTISRGPMARKKLSREQYYSPQRIALVRARGYVLSRSLPATPRVQLPGTVVSLGSLPLPLHAYLVRMPVKGQHPQVAAYGLKMSPYLWWFDFPGCQGYS